MDCQGSDQTRQIPNMSSLDEAQMNAQPTQTSLHICLVYSVFVCIRKLVSLTAYGVHRKVGLADQSLAGFT